MELSDHEKVKILVFALKQYSSLLNWTSCIEQQKNTPHINKWIGDGNGYDLARRTLDIVKARNDDTFIK